MSRKIAIVILIAYLTMLMAQAIGMVGEFRYCNDAPLNWEFPLLFLLMVSFPAILGYFIGLDRGE